MSLEGPLSSASLFCAPGGKYLYGYVYLREYIHTYVSVNGFVAAPRRAQTSCCGEGHSWGQEIFWSPHPSPQCCHGAGQEHRGDTAPVAGPASRRCHVCVPRIESYSCKMAGDDKHMFKQFCQEGQPHVLEALSPPQTTGISPSRYRGTGGRDSWRERAFVGGCCRGCGAGPAELSVY